MKLLSLLAVVLVGASSVLAQDSIPAIERRLPAAGTVELPAEVREELDGRLAEYIDRIWEIDQREYAADVGALVKAVRFAVQFGEFYKESDFAIATEMLDLADKRYLEIIETETRTWTDDRGLVIRGFESEIDKSYQPYGLEVPENLDLSEPVPLIVWLHGRGDKVTDLHFLNRCATKSQSFGGFVQDQQECIILHPFGRQCVGWKHAGEIDIFEAIEAVKRDYPIDEDRIVLAGFSMGGAGAWHVGAHYPEHFCAIQPGAGFVETKEYNKLTPDQYPADFVQTLWQVYDVPDYVRNFLNIPVLAYSGAEDKQKQAADLMARELKTVGHELRHVIGEGMEHKFNQESVDEIWAWLKEQWTAGRPASPETIEWQTPTLRYGKHRWLQLTGLEKHWESAVVSARRSADSVSLDVKNVSAVELGGEEGDNFAGMSITINGQELVSSDPGFPLQSVSLMKNGDSWAWGEPDLSSKRPGMQGPIDDAFLSHFIVVPPDSDPKSAKFAKWVQFERDHFSERWQALMRGELIERTAGELDADDLSDANLILWGDPESNAMISEIISGLPIKWDADSFTFRGETYSAENHAPVFIFPNPLNPDRYVVINSGLTFRDGHDRTNSQQNPKLPDWAVIGLDQLPDEFAPGKIVAAGFFDENWK